MKWGAGSLTEWRRFEVGAEQKTPRDCWAASRSLVKAGGQEFMVLHMVGSGQACPGLAMGQDG